MNDIRKKHEEQKKHRDGYFFSMLTIAEVDSIFAALDDALKDRAAFVEKWRKADAQLDETKANIVNMSGLCSDAAELLMQKDIALDEARGKVEQALELVREDWMIACCESTPCYNYCQEVRKILSGKGDPTK